MEIILGSGLLNIPKPMIKNADDILDLMLLYWYSDLFLFSFFNWVPMIQPPQVFSNRQIH